MVIYRKVEKNTTLYAEKKAEHENSEKNVIKGPIQKKTPGLYSKKKTYQLEWSETLKKKLDIN